eukprot:4847020-Lingulodinium_polyedra.AAC.1
MRNNPTHPQNNAPDRASLEEPATHYAEEEQTRSGHAWTPPPRPHCPCTGHAHHEFHHKRHS